MQHPVIPTTRFVQRRQRLQNMMNGSILLMGNRDHPRNFPANTLPFRQDSTFWYYTGVDHPNAAWFSSSSEDILFLPAQHPSDVLWHGPHESNEEIARRLGFLNWKPRASLDAFMQQQRDVHSIAIADIETNQWLSKLLDMDLIFGQHNGSEGLIDSVIEMRRILDDDEIRQLRWTAQITDQAHRSAMQHTKVGGHELDVAAAFHHPIQKAGLQTAYHSIVTVDGEILHNHAYKNHLKDGDLLLLDGGAESPFGYATDVTRTWPVSGEFSPRQRRAYAAVLRSQEQAVAMVRPGVRYRDVHMAASLILTEFLVDEKLLIGNPEDLVKQGAHALFFPHGIGHLLSLDVHDMENFGDRAAYAKGRTRSAQFGTGYLRMDMDLEPNMVVTIEPGFYICPAIFADQTLYATFKDVVNWDVLEHWKGFGGIRIEDDIRCTTEGPENLTAMIPKQIDELTSIVGSV